MLNYFYNKRIISLKRRIRELEEELNSVNDKSAISSIYSKKNMLEQEGIFKLLLDNVNDIITLFSSSNMIVYISPSCFKWLGYLPEEMEGKYSLFYVHPDDQQIMLEVMQQFNSDKILQSKSHRLVHKDGSSVWVESSWKPIYLEYNGQLTHAVISTLLRNDSIIENKL
jgi:PAS domain S-box-containing protein